MAGGQLFYHDGTNIVINTAGTSGQAAISGGTGAPTFGTLGVAGGGSGVATFANTSALIATGTTSTGAVQNIASVGTGQVLVSSGTSTLPAYSATPTVTSITFGAGTALNTYIQGTFTPGISFGGGTTGITYSDQLGQYARIGNIFFFNLLLTLSNKGSSTGNASLTGFPVDATPLENSMIILDARNMSFTATYIYPTVNTSGMSGGVTAIFQYSPSLGITRLTDAQFQNNSRFEFIGFYFTS